jgi:hypothetical protein
MIITTASTFSSSSSSTACLISGSVSSCTVRRDSRYSELRAAASRASSICCGPNWLVPHVATPINRERLEASSRADRLRR